MPKIPVAGWVIMVVLAGLFLQAEIRRAEARGAAVESADRADEAVAALEDSSAAYRDRETAANERIQRLSGDLDSLNGVVRVVARSARREASKADSILGSLAAAATTPEDSTALELVAGAIDTLIQANEVCGIALATCGELRTELEIRVLEAGRMIIQHETTMEEQSRAILALRSVRAPPRPLLGTKDLVVILLSVGITLFLTK